MGIFIECHLHTRPLLIVAGSTAIKKEDKWIGNMLDDNDCEIKKLSEEGEVCESEGLHYASALGGP